MRAVIEAEEFKQIINATKKFVGDTSNRMMSYIYLEINADLKEIRATALDGYRVSIEYAKVKEVDESFNCFVKPIIPKVTKYDRDAVLEMVDNKLLITVGNNITGYIQPEGEYFKVDDLIKNLSAYEMGATIWVNPTMLKAALENVADMQYRKAVKLIIPKNPKAAIRVESGIKREKRNLKFVLPVRGMEEE